MRLKTYLADIDMTYKRLGEILGVNSHYLSRIARGHISPSHDLANQINKWTKGIVNIEPSQVKAKKRSRTIVANAAARAAAKEAREKVLREWDDSMMDVSSQN